MLEQDEVERSVEELVDMYHHFIQDLEQEPAKLFLYLEEAVEDFLCLDRYIDASIKCVVADDLILEMEIGKENFYKLGKWVQEEKRRKIALQVGKKIT